MATTKIGQKFRQSFTQVGSVAADTSFLLLWGLIQALAEYIVSMILPRMSITDQMILRFIQVAFGISTILPILENVKAEFQIIRERNKRRILVAHRLLTRPCATENCPMNNEVDLSDLGIPDEG